MKMAFARFLLIFLTLFDTILSKDITEVKEFEENKISSEIEKFSFKTKNINFIIIIIKNQNLERDTDSPRKLFIFDSYSKKSREYDLDSISYIVLDKEPSKTEIEYVLKFKNYKEGNFVIFNSANSFPLKKFEKEFSLTYNSKQDKNISLSFFSEALVEDIILDLVIIDNNIDIKITNISGTSETSFTVKGTSAVELKKDSKYKFEFSFWGFHWGYTKLNFAMKKREIIKYNKGDELKLNLFYNLPVYILIKVSDFINDNNNKMYALLHNKETYTYNFSTANLDSENIESWDNLKFTKEYSGYTHFRDIYIEDTNISEYKLFKIDFSKQDYFFAIFKIFESCSYKEEIKSKETLHLYEQHGIYYFKTLLIFSTLNNLRTFEENEVKNFIYTKPSIFYTASDNWAFTYIVTPTNEDFKLNSLTFHERFKLFKNKFSFRYFFESFFNEDRTKYTLFFDINKGSILSLKSDLNINSNYSNISYIEKINYNILYDIFYWSEYPNITQLNSTNEILYFDSPIILIMEIVPNSYLSISLNEIESLSIPKEISTFNLYENKEYSLISSKLIIKINKDLDSNIYIYQKGKLIATLNKQKSFIKLDESYGELILKSDTNTTINFYYDINQIFPLVNYYVIEYPKDKDEIMKVEILENDSYSGYIIDFGYEGYITPDANKNNSTNKYFIIDDPSLEFNLQNEDLKYYLILFAKSLKYEVKFYKKFKKNNFYYKITTDENYGILTNDINALSYQTLLCENSQINMTITNMLQSKSYLRLNSNIYQYGKDFSSRGYNLITFKSNSEFLFLQNYYDSNKIMGSFIEFFVPRIEDNKISILIRSKYINDLNYSILIVEDKEKDEKLLKKLDNECYLLSLLQNQVNDINYDLITVPNNEKSFMIIQEIDYSKFASSKYLLIKIFNCENDVNYCSFSITQRIYLENIKDDDEGQDGITKIEESREYNVTRTEYIFSYNNKNYLNNISDIVINITNFGKDPFWEINIINPSMGYQTLTSSDPYLYLQKNKYFNTIGKYYFIFKNSPGLSFYVHNSIYFIDLNKVSHYIPKKITGLTYFYYSMNIEEDRYVYLDYEGDIIIYKTDNKEYITLSYKNHNAYAFQKGSYIIFIDFTQEYYLYNFKYAMNINYFIQNPGINEEFKSNNLYYLNMSEYDQDNIYFISEKSNIKILYTCLVGFSMDYILDSYNSRSHYLENNINKLSQVNKGGCKYLSFIPSERFELVNEFYFVNKSENFKFTHNNTVVFEVDANGYIFIESNQENIKIIGNYENEFVNKIFIRNKIIFKLKSNDKTETNLRINIIENKNNIQLESLTVDELSSRIYYNSSSKDIKYLINLSKNKYFINHFDYEGNLKFYISKQDFNGINLGELKTNEIDMNLFELVTKEKFEIDNNNKIIAIETQNDIISELLISSELNSQLLENYNSKILYSNKKYFLINDLKILLDENSNANIKLMDINNTVISTINKDHPILDRIYYNKVLFLVSDRDALIYIYHGINAKSRTITISKNKKGKFLLANRDCGNYELEYTLDFGFENYTAVGLKFNKFYSYSGITILNITNNYKTQKNIELLAYYQCNQYLVSHYSGFYEDLKTNEGTNHLKNIKYANTKISLGGKNLFYQIITNENNNIIFASINNDDTLIQSLSYNIGIIDSTNEGSVARIDDITFYIKSDDLYFNYYKTKHTFEEYQIIARSKVSGYYTLIEFGSRSYINIRPIYENIDTEFYLVMYVDEDKSISKNPFNNHIYLKEIFDNRNNLPKKPKIVIKNISYRSGNFSTQLLDLPKTYNHTMIYTNIIGVAKIFDDIEELIFYSGYNFEFVTYDPDYNYDPNEDNNKKSSNALSGGEIAGIVIGIIVVGLIFAYVILKTRKKDSTSIEKKDSSNNLEQKLV